MPKSSAIYLRGVPRHVKDHFKARCAKRGESMTKALIDFMRQAIEKDKAYELAYGTQTRERTKF